MSARHAAQPLVVVRKIVNLKENARQGVFFSIIRHMKVFVVYKQESDYARTVLDWLREFGRQTGKKLEEVDPDTRAGSMFCRDYDIVEYPTLVALDDDGQIHNVWRGAMLPTISEVSYYVQ